jgi:hypothetical protein
MMICARWGTTAKPKVSPREDAMNWLAEFHREPWVRRVFALSLKAGLAVLGMLVWFFLTLPMQTKDFDFAVWLCGLTLGAMMLVTVVTALVWFTKREPLGFQRLAVLVYCASFLGSAVWFHWHYPRYVYRGYAFLSDVLFPAFIICLGTAVAYLAAIRLYRWIADGFAKP